MALSPDVWFAVFRGDFGNEFFDLKIESWAVTHWFRVTPDNGLLGAEFAIRSWFSSRWTASLPGTGGPINHEVRWRVMRVESSDGAQVVEDDSLNVQSAGLINSVGMLPTQCSMLILGRSLQLGLTGRIYLPGIERGALIPGEPSFDHNQWTVLWRDWWQAGTFGGITAKPIVVSRKSEIEADPVDVVLVRWPRTQRRRTRDLPTPFIVLPVAQ